MNGITADYIILDEADNLPENLDKVYNELIKPRLRIEICKDSFFYKEYKKQRDKDAATKFIPHHRTITNR